jgi:preprotein translocase subunit SecG
MLRKASILVVFSLIIGLFQLFIFSPTAQAAGATLFLSPASGAYTVNKPFSVKVMVNSGGQTINAAEAGLKFDSQYLMVSSISEASTIFSLWTAKPSFSNTNGTISFGGGLYSPGYNGSAGTIFSIVFSSKKEGTTKVTLNNGVILLDDGKGTNAFSGFGNGTYVIGAPVAAPKVETPIKPEVSKPVVEEKLKGALPPAPDVMSATHPDDTIWYSNNNPEFSWKLITDITGVSVLMDENSISSPGSASEGVIEAKKYENVKDGIHYFHIRYKNQYGQSLVTHKKIMIDSTPPVKKDLAINNEGDQTNPLPLADFATEDLISGIDYYELNIDGETSKIQPRSFSTDPYRLKLLKPGEHNLFIAAVDKAKNKASSSKTFIVEPLKSPIIIDSPKNLINTQSLIVRGTSFYPQVNITLYISKDAKEPELFKVKTDNDGNWSYFHDKKIEDGSYEIWAKIIDNRGAESLDSSRQYLMVISPSFIQRFGWWIVVILLIIITGLVLVIIYQRKKYKEESARIKRETTEAKTKISEVFNAIRDEIDELIEFADKKPGVSESEKRVKEKLKEAIDVSDEFISKEINDISKEIS